MKKLTQSTLAYGATNRPLKIQSVNLRKPKAVVRIVKKQHVGMDDKPRYWFTLVASNSEPLVTSECYTRKSSRDKTVALLLRARMEA